MPDNGTTHVKKHFTGYVALHSINDITNKYGVFCCVPYGIIYTLN